MKRYLVFATWDRSDTHPGWEAFKGDFSGVSDAKMECDRQCHSEHDGGEGYSQGHVVDTEAMKIIYKIPENPFDRGKVNTKR